MLNSNVRACSLEAIRYQRKSDRGVVYAIWWNASVVNSLKEENSSHGSKTKSTVNCAQRRSGAGLVVVLGSAVGSFSGRVFLPTRALVFALDGLLVVHRVVVAAGHVFGRLEVEGALDSIELGSFDTTHW
jgi:hypothetical protein